MSLTDVDICNRSLVRLGSLEIADFDDGDIGATCKTLYQGIKESLLGRRRWTFATRKKKLDRNAQAPANEYQYAYDIPEDNLAMGVDAVYVSDQAGAKPSQSGWRIIGDAIITDEELIVIDYRYDVDASVLPPVFVELLVLAICAALAPTVTTIGSLAEEYNARAWGTPGESYMGGWYAVAVAQDDSGEPSEGFQLDELNDVRFS